MKLAISPEPVNTSEDKLPEKFKTEPTSSNALSTGCIDKVPVVVIATLVSAAIEFPTTVISPLPAFIFLVPAESKN